MKCIPKEDLIKLLQCDDRSLISEITIKSMFELYADEYYINRDIGDYELSVENPVRKLALNPGLCTCKDCKHWLDSDGVYRRGIDAESKCPVNNSRVFEGTFYCKDFDSIYIQNND